MKGAALLLAFIVVVFATRNLPWHLDDFDQAKQAYTSYEMVTQGHWWFQHTPTGRIATKPPLAGWVSALFYGMMGGHGWPLAWRLPPFLCALVLLRMLLKSGRDLGGEMAAVLAVAALALNLTAPRLATLVRTDMMLTLCIFIAGWLIFERLRRAEPWTTRERWWLFAAMLASMLMKGPIAYAFLLPGLVAWLWLMRREPRRGLVWCGWWPWFLPLVFFGAWAGIGISMSPEFYEQVVLKEFLGRFTVGEDAVHNNQPVYFYVVHVLHKWLPWSVGFLALCATRRARWAMRSEPALLWLACWAIGGFVLMSLVPSKRPDRIFPVIPPLCLLAAALYERVAREEPVRCRKLALGAVAFAVIFGGGYSLLRTIGSYRAQQGALVAFGKQARDLAAKRPDRLAVVNAKDEGMVMYTGATRFTSADDALALWRAERIDWLVLGEATLAEREAELQPYRQVLALPKVPKKAGAYILISRPGAERVPGDQ
jgi:4-amino-4-deoxy-L-arabinose transferase-like glycosyltransferase